MRLHLVNECQIYQLQATIFHEALLNCLPLSNGAANALANYFSITLLSSFYRESIIYFAITLRFPDQSLTPFQGTKKKVSHVPLMSRPTEREFCILKYFWKLFKNYLNACYKWNMNYLFSSKLLTKLFSQIYFLAPLI